MSFFSLLETLLIGPLKLVFEIIFQLGMLFTQNPGISIVFLSLAMNFLVLPLYRRADAMQEQSRDVEAKLRDGVTHIKKTFSGDERMMILQAYYRQNDYKPTDVLRGSVSLLLEIPFFMAAYQFLSHLKTLEGISFGPIADLGAPDGLLTVGGVTLNALPIIMTLINVVSSALYLKGFPLKTKLQLYGMALFFLVFLYTSPAGLVFYWTLNNVFSLVKNIFYKIKNPGLVLNVTAFILGTAACFLAVFDNEMGLDLPGKPILLIGLILVLPPLTKLIKRFVKLPFKAGTKERKPSRATFIMGALFLTVFIGVLIPSNFIADSPQEFVDLGNFYHPLLYILNSVCLAAGTFLIWLGVFYWLANEKWKIIFERGICALCGIVITNYMFFGTDLGVISASLQYENGLVFTDHDKLVNLAVLLGVALLIYFIVAKLNRAAKTVLLTAIIALNVMAGMNIMTIRDSVNSIKIDESEAFPTFRLSKEGQNVVVFMIDRAMGEYIPYIFNEKPELVEMFDGFTYYSNTISYGGHTNMASPAMMGGYEYTPVEMNKRDDVSLAEKHNESAKVLPVLFSENGYKVTVCDTPYAGYKFIPDMSIYDEYPGINAYMTEGIFGHRNEDYDTYNIDTMNRNFFCFSVMKSMPLFMQGAIYNNGIYHQSYIPTWAATQTRDGLSKSVGLFKDFMEPYEVLNNLDTMTNVTEGSDNTFLFLYNDAPHEPMLLQEPEYEPTEVVDNTEYDAAHADRFTVDGKSISVTTEKQMIHYQSNVATLLKLGEWFDYLRENDVYDNTRIIIGADHGYYLYQSEQLVHGDYDISNYYPLLMVKDFNSEGFTTSDEFMTNADVPTIATEGVIENAANPFTGKLLAGDEKTAHDQFIMLSRDWKVDNNNGNAFSASKWAVVTDDLWNRDDWQFITESVILKEHKIPD